MINIIWRTGNVIRLAGFYILRFFCLKGIRSVSFNENIVTIGTGLGSILFYDLNAGKYLECSCGHCRHTCILKSGPGYLVSTSKSIT